MAETVIEEAVVTPGHDGQAQLVVHVKHENGAVSSVTLDADWARKLMELCRVDSAEGLRGQPWECFLGLIPGPLENERCVDGTPRDSLPKRKPESSCSTS